MPASRRPSWRHAACGACSRSTSSGARALEWSAAQGSWRELDGAGSIEDPALEVPLPIAAMVHAAKADDAMARALLIKANPVLVEANARSREDGRREGVAEALIGVLAARGISLDPADRARILGERDSQRLARWIARVASCTSTVDLFAEP